MKILLINIDSKIPNWALKKIEKYHRDKSDEIIWNNPLFRDIVDKVYVSCVFKKNKPQTAEWENRAEIGGSGHFLEKNLSPEIEAVKPRINLGFTTRGCIRHCDFCIVPKKEGEIRVVGDLLDLWDGKSRDIIILDNNILALPWHFRLVCKQARENKLRLDFNQGLDHRLLTHDIVSELKTIRHNDFRFAFDRLSYLPTVERAINLLQDAKINRCTWYVLVGYDTTYQEDLKRVKYLKIRGQNAFIQRYETCYAEKKYIVLAQWVNQHHIFQKMTFKQFLELPKNKCYREATNGP